MLMIRINLLPTRHVKKREMGRQILVVAAGVLVAGFAANYLWYDSRDTVRVRNEAQIKATEAQIQELQAKIGEVDKLNSRKKEVEEKLNVLNNLKKGRSGPVKFMDALSTAMPKNVWLRQLKEKEQKVTLQGSAVSHEHVAEMMRSLTNIVWTPKGMGRLVEQKREAKSTRVELLANEGTLEDFPLADVKFFFQNIDLKKAEQKADKEKSTAGSALTKVDFEISMTTNYAI
jgi:type IV pilus assembly protein PilN